jgi:hypothetical protein
MCFAGAADDDTARSVAREIVGLDPAAGEGAAAAAAASGPSLRESSTDSAASINPEGAAPLA